MNKKSQSCVFKNVFLFLLFCVPVVYANGAPSAVQNAQMVYNDTSNSFIASWDPPPETVTEYDLTYWVERMDLLAEGGDALYGFEVARDYSMDVDESDTFPPSPTQIIMPSGPDVYGKRAYASIRPKNTDGNGPVVNVELEEFVTPPGAPSNLDYEIREAEQVAFFSWDAASAAGIPASLDVYYRVDYVTDSGAADYKYYSSNFAALDLTNDQYWDYSVSVCVYVNCGNASTIRAYLVEIDPPSAVQNEQIVYNDTSNSFVVTWDPPPEPVTEYDLTYWVERMDLLAEGGDALYGFEVARDYSMDVDVSDTFPPTPTQIVMPSGPDVYGKRASASIRPKNTGGNGPAISVELEEFVQPPSAPSNLAYEIREDELVVYFSWDAASTAGIPASLDVYYRVDYVSDSGVAGNKYYSSNYAALDLTDDEYWDYSVSVCVYENCGNAATIRAELITIDPPTAVQNAQMVYNDTSNSFVVTWDSPPEPVSEYDLSYWVEEMSLSAQGGDAVYGFEVERDFELDNDTSDTFPPTPTQIVMPSPPDVYGKYAYASITPKNIEGNGPPVTVEMEEFVAPPNAPSNLAYEIREDELVVYFSWDAASTAGIPASLDVYYRVDYVSDSGVAGYKYYSSNFAALDITDDEYWDYSVSVCVYKNCGDAATIRAVLTTLQVAIVESGFESGMPDGWTNSSNFWQVGSGQTPTSLTGPGGAASGSSYLYFETSPPAGSGAVAIFESPNFNPLNSRLYFSYHMYGSTTGNLYVEVYEDGWNTIWQRNGQQHTGYNSPWTDVEIDLSSYESDMKVRFRGVDGNGETGDMALDDIRITAVISRVGGLVAQYSGYPAGLKLSWNEVSAAWRYDVARSTNSGASWDYNYASATDAEFIDTDVDDTSLTYSYRVRHCSHICSSWSASPWVQE